jgi:hypothetical protein
VAGLADERPTLLPEVRLGRLEAALAAASTFEVPREQLRRHSAAALENSKSLATTVIGSQEHTDAATGFSAAHSLIAKTVAALTSGRERYETAHNELAADDEAKETYGPRIMTGEHAGDLLRSRLRDLIGQAIRRPRPAADLVYHRPRLESTSLGRHHLAGDRSRSPRLPDQLRHHRPGQPTGARTSPQPARAHTAPTVAQRARHQARTDTAMAMTSNEAALEGSKTSRSSGPPGYDATEYGSGGGYIFCANPSTTSKRPGSLVTPAHGPCSAGARALGTARPCGRLSRLAGRAGRRRRRAARHAGIAQQGDTGAWRLQHLWL